MLSLHHAPTIVFDIPRFYESRIPYKYPRTKILLKINEAFRELGDAKIMELLMNHPTGELENNMFFFITSLVKSFSRKNWFVIKTSTDTLAWQVV